MAAGTKPDLKKRPRHGVRQFDKLDVDARDERASGVEVRGEFEVGLERSPVSRDVKACGGGLALGDKEGDDA